MPKLPARARYELIQAVIKAFDNETRRQIMAYLYEAGKAGLRPSEIARRTGEAPDTVRKSLHVLQLALLVSNEVGRDQGGVYSRYRITDYGEEWFASKMGLTEGKRALPLVADG